MIGTATVHLILILISLDAMKKSVKKCKVRLFSIQVQGKLHLNAVYSTQHAYVVDTRPAPGLSATENNY